MVAARHHGAAATPGQVDRLLALYEAPRHARSLIRDHQLQCGRRILRGGPDVGERAGEISSGLVTDDAVRDDSRRLVFLFA